MLSKFSSGKGECTIIWKVENYSFALRKNSSDVCGVRFCSEMIDYTKWILYLVKDTETSENVVCLLKRKPGGPDNVTIAFRVIVLSPDGNDFVLTDVASRIFGKEGYYSSNSIEQTSKPLSNFLWKDTLILKCCLKKVFCENLISKTCFVRSRSNFEKKDFLWTPRFIYDANRVEVFSIDLQSSLHGISALNVELEYYGRVEEYLLIRIRAGDVAKAMNVRCKIFHLDSKGNILANAEDEHSFEKQSRPDIWRFPNFIKGSTLIESLFHLKFQLTVYSKSGETVSEKDFYKFRGGQESDSVAKKLTLSNDILRMYTEKKFCDVTLHAGDKEFGAHKNILSMRSPVFDSMFQNDMLEKKTGVVNVTDVDADILNMMLKYMYSDELEDLKIEDAMKLYQAADKYQILSLKDDCSSILKASLTSSNVFPILAFADDHHDGNLKTAVKDFICIFGYELLDSDMWRNFMAERVPLAAEIMHEVTMNCLKLM